MMKELKQISMAEEEYEIPKLVPSPSPERKFTPGEIERMGQESIDAELEENDIRRFKAQIQRELDRRFPMASLKEKEDYLDRLETELRDAFDKTCGAKGCWHKIQSVMPSVLGFQNRIGILVSYKARDQKGNVEEIFYDINLPGFLPKTVGAKAAGKNIPMEYTKGEKPSSLRDFFEEKLVDVDLYDLREKLTQLAINSPNFPLSEIQNLTYEIEMAFSEIRASGDNEERMKEIARRTMHELGDKAEALLDQAFGTYVTDTHMDFQQFNEERDNPDTLVGSVFLQLQTTGSIISKLAGSQNSDFVEEIEKDF